MKLLPIKTFTLSLDRTNWQFGRFDINILVLGIVYKKVAFPVFWTCLSKRGNSNTEERINIIEKFIEYFGTKKISCFTADREFIGNKWFKYLLGQGIHFSIRIRENMLIENSRGTLSPAKNLLRNLKIGSYRILNGKRLVAGVKLFVIGMKIKDEYLILLTDYAPELAIEEYKKRWGIETLFGCLKKRGFCFESTHLNKLERIEKLVAILAITFSIYHTIGEWKNEVKEIKIKKHGRKAISLFRYGLDFIREILLNSFDIVNRKKLKTIIQLINSKLSSAYA